MVKKASDFDRNFSIHKRLKGILSRQEEIQDLIKERRFLAAERNIEYAIIYTKLVIEKFETFLKKPKKGAD